MYEQWGHWCSVAAALLLLLLEVVVTLDRRRWDEEDGQVGSDDTVDTPLEVVVTTAALPRAAGELLAATLPPEPGELPRSSAVCTCN